eukprot:TRINITY_DN11608_c0_g1_i1.p1 TRINITY_DN11608_c0_g1~~TRINITY_DN11608_c0_g1_i1.p1  ORF type:complete len:457 (+),score=82.28 TRINITY_DN11608_c0_g1_i1:95-1372(+)
MAASVRQTIESINTACKKRGGVYAEYSCKTVSWDDASRGTVAGSLSCWGSNITDTYLKSKTGEELFTVRSDNWNEKLAMVASSEVALIAGSHEQGPCNAAPITLRDMLKNIGRYGSYAGLDRQLDLSNDILDAKCSIRFQTTFLPVSGAQGTIEFATEAYNYNTVSNEDPRNLVLLCTSQGVAVQQDGSGVQKLFSHSVDDQGLIHRYWLEAERSKHRVGGSQGESVEEREEAQKRRKATAAVIGTKAMGTRFNVLMTIQIPLEQKQPTDVGGFGAPVFEGLNPWDAALIFGSDVERGESVLRSVSYPSLFPEIGTANAARVSRGSEHDVWSGLSLHQPQRNSSEHVTITVVNYNTVVDGIPSEADVVAAIDDLEALYASCLSTGRLSEPTFDFMKKPLSASTTEAYEPPIVNVANFDTFPEPSL